MGTQSVRSRNQYSDDQIPRRLSRSDTVAGGHGRTTSASNNDGGSSSRLNTPTVQGQNRRHDIPFRRNQGHTSSSIDQYDNNLPTFYRENTGRSASSSNWRSTSKSSTAARQDGSNAEVFSFGRDRGRSSSSTYPSASLWPAYSSQSQGRASSSGNWRASSGSSTPATQGGYNNKEGFLFGRVSAPHLSSTPSSFRPETRRASNQQGQRNNPERKTSKW